MRWHVLRVLWLLLALMLSGCSANYDSIYRHELIANQDSSLTFVDAKQRVVLQSMGPMEAPAVASTSGSPPESRNPIDSRPIYCVEPSPDVFSVMAQAASGTASFGKTANPAAVQAAASLALSSSEQGATIPRTQTINMLREVMFRTCERYLDGAIGDLEMSIQAARDQRMMIATLAIEQLTDAARPAVIDIGVAGEAGAGSVRADAVVRLDDAYKALDSANKAITDDQSAYDKLNQTDPTCDAIKKKSDGKDALSADEVSKQADCAKATSILADAKTVQQAASSKVDKLNAVAADSSSSITTPKNLASDQQSGDSQPNAINAVAQTIGEIVKENYSQDEFLLLCLKVLSPQAIRDSRLPQLTEDCYQYVTSGLKLEAAKRDSDRKQIELKASYLGEIDERFSVFWKKVALTSNSDEPDVKLLSARIGIAKTTLGPKSYDLRTLDRLASVRSREDARSIFGTLQPRTQIDLIH